MNFDTITKLFDLGFPLKEVHPYQLNTEWPSFILAGKKFYFPKHDALLSELIYENFVINCAKNGLYKVVAPEDRIPEHAGSEDWVDSIELALAIYWIKLKKDGKTN